MARVGAGCAALTNTLPGPGWETEEGSRDKKALRVGRRGEGGATFRPVTTTFERNVGRGKDWAPGPDAQPHIIWSMDVALQVRSLLCVRPECGMLTAIACVPVQPELTMRL